MRMQTTAIQELQRQKMLLQMEYYTEKEAFRKQTEAMGLLRKVKRGDAWFPLSVGRSYYNSMNQMALEVRRTADQDIEHNFEFGRPAIFFTIQKVNGEAKERLHYFNFSCVVSYVDGDNMVVILPDAGRVIDLQHAQGQVGVQLFFDETSYKCMFDALDRVINAKGNRLAYLRDLFYSGQHAQRFTFESQRFPWLNPRTCRKRSVVGQRGGCGAWATGHRKDHNLGRSNQRNLDEREPSACVCTEQYGFRLDIRAVG